MEELIGFSRPVSDVKINRFGNYVGWSRLHAVKTICRKETEKQKVCREALELFNGSTGIHR